MSAEWLQPQEGKSAIIKLEDGTEIKCLVNETAYKPVPKLTEEFVSNIPDGEIVVTITDENRDPEYQTSTLNYGSPAFIEFMFDTDNEWIHVSGRSETDQIRNSLEAKLDYLAMMLDVDLDEE